MTWRSFGSTPTLTWAPVRPPMPASTPWSSPRSPVTATRSSSRYCRPRPPPIGSRSSACMTGPTRRCRQSPPQHCRSVPRGSRHRRCEVVAVTIAEFIPRQVMQLLTLPGFRCSVREPEETPHDKPPLDGTGLSHPGTAASCQFARARWRGQGPSCTHARLCHTAGIARGRRRLPPRGREQRGRGHAEHQGAAAGGAAAERVPEPHPVARGHPGAGRRGRGRGGDRPGAWADRSGERPRNGRGDRRD